jgi:aspartate racemase
MTESHADFRPQLGILGGMGPQATQVFYQRILDRTEADRDQDHLPALILSDTGMPDRTEAILHGGDKARAVFDRMLNDAKMLEQCGCRLIAIPCNTSHYFVDALQSHLSIPILHMIRETVAEMVRRGKRRPCVLGTDGTVQMGLYRRACEEAGLPCLSPPEKEQRLVMSIIYDEIKKGEQGSREKFATIDRKVREMGCDCAILACTELSVYRNYHGLPDFYLDAMEVLVEQAILRCGKKLRNV